MAASKLELDGSVTVQMKSDPNASYVNKSLHEILVMAQAIKSNTNTIVLTNDLKNYYGYTVWFYTVASVTDFYIRNDLGSSAPAMLGFYPKPSPNQTFNYMLSSNNNSLTVYGSAFTFYNITYDGNVYGCINDIVDPVTYRYNGPMIIYTEADVQNIYFNGVKQSLNNWQSLPSLTGKGKTIQLTTLNDINNGSAITTSDASKFNSTTASNILTLISNNLE